MATVLNLVARSMNEKLKGRRRRDGEKGWKRCCVISLTSRLRGAVTVGIYKNLDSIFFICISLASSFRWNIQEQSFFRDQVFYSLANCPLIPFRCRTSFWKGLRQSAASWIGLTCGNADTFMPRSGFIQIYSQQTSRKSWNVKSFIMLLICNIFLCSLPPFFVHSLCPSNVIFVEELCVTIVKWLLCFKSVRCRRCQEARVEVS